MNEKGTWAGMARSFSLKHAESKGLGKRTVIFDLCVHSRNPLSARYQDCSASSKISSPSVYAFIRGEITKQQTFQFWNNSLPYRPIWNIVFTRKFARDREKRESMHLFFSFPDNHELQVLVMNLRDHINNTGEILVRQLRRKDYLITKCEKLCAIITAHLQARSPKRGKYKLSVSISN